MNVEESKQSNPVGDQNVPVDNLGAGETRTPVERAADIAREQATMAAEALRRGEFMREVSVDNAASADDRLIALLSYASQIIIPLAMPVIVLLSESSKKRPFQRYHAVQSLALTVLFGVISTLVAIGTLVLQVIPIIGWLISLVILCLSPIAWFMAVIAMLYYGYQAYQGKRFGIPGLTSFLLDQGWLR